MKTTQKILVFLIVIIWLAVPVAAYFDDIIFPNYPFWFYLVRSSIEAALFSVGIAVGWMVTKQSDTDEFSNREI